MEFTVPNKEPTGGKSSEFITVSNESPPPNLPGTDYFFFHILIF